MTAQGIVTEIGVFGLNGGGAPGDRVRVMIRPDDVSFVPDPAGDAVIVRRYFRGSQNPTASAYPNGLRVRPEGHVLHVVTFPAA